MTNIAYVMVWLQYLLQELDVISQTPTPMYYDDQVIIFMASNPTFYEWTKYIEHDCHNIYDKVDKCKITVIERPSSHIKNYTRLQIWFWTLE